MPIAPPKLRSSPVLLRSLPFVRQPRSSDSTVDVAAAGSGGGLPPVAVRPEEIEQEWSHRLRQCRCRSIKPWPSMPFGLANELQHRRPHWNTCGLSSGATLLMKATTVTATRINTTSATTTFTSTNLPCTTFTIKTQTRKWKKVRRRFTAPNGEAHRRFFLKTTVPYSIIIISSGGQGLQTGQHLELSQYAHVTNR